MVHSEDIPQADTLDLMLYLIEIYHNQSLNILARKLNIEPRQVYYYKHAARLFILLDSNNRPTSRALLLNRVAIKSLKYQVLAIWIEETTFMKLWLAWYGAQILPELDPESAQQFLIESCIGLSSTTIERRAQTLTIWSNKLIPYHPVLLSQ